MGELHLLSGPGFVSEQAEVVLDSFRRQQLQLGMSGELRLINSKQLCSIRVGLPIGDTHEMMIQGDVLVNEQPILTECSLQDGDILTLGQTRLQYSNLRLHAAQQDALTHLNHTDPAF